MRNSVLILIVRLLSCLPLLALLNGCRTTPIDRAGETGRLNRELGQRLTDTQLPAAAPLSLERCVEIALQNNLEHRVRKLRLEMQDDQVRLSLADALPKINVAYARTRRSNPAMTDLGGMVVETEDRSQKGLNVQGVLPILDWGTTYYAWQMAKDRRRQEQLMVERARQLLTRDVCIAYARLAAAQRQEQLARVALMAARELLKVAQSMEREGLDSRAATAEIESGLAQAALAWSNLRRNVEQTHLILAQTLSLPAGTGFTITAVLPPLPALPAAGEVPQLEQSALQCRPELQIQDRSRQIAANAVRQQLAKFLPHLDLTSGYLWSDASQLVNHSYYTYGFQVTDSLLDGGRNWWNFRSARKNVKTEAERTLLLSLGVLYEVDFSVIQLFTMYDAMIANNAMVKAQQETLKLIVTRFREGLETGSDAVRSLAQMYLARLQLDQTQTDYLTAWYGLEATALRGTVPSGSLPVEPGLPGFTPAPALDTYRKMLDAAPAVDPHQFPELEVLLKTAERHADQ